jgi:dihydropteroate synthase-like protein
MERILFLTGRLARQSLEQVLSGIVPPAFAWEVRDIGLQVAGLMTAGMIRRRVPKPENVDRVLVPGRCRGDLDALSSEFGLPVERGPEDLKDIPAHFQREARPVDLSRYDIEIFAEIVDAPKLGVDAIVARARRHRDDGADVIDLGCLPETPFAHLEDAIRALKDDGLRVSVDSLDTAELLRGGRAGADYLLSLSIDTLWIADEVVSTPVLIPREPTDESSLYQAIQAMAARKRPFFADAIIDPIPFGFTAAIARFDRLRSEFPAAPIFMGIGNVTELTDADTSGMNAILLGIAAELGASAVLTTQVSGHARRAIREADVARRMMYAAREERALAVGYSAELLTVHDKRPFPDSPDEIAGMARRIRDPSYRIQISDQGVHVYNRDGHHVSEDAFALFPRLDVAGDANHAFYLGVELARAETAWRLGKRYVQDQPLDWGCAVDRATEDLERWHAPGPTMSEGKDDR